MGGGGAFKTKKCGVEPEGRWWRGRRRRCGRSRPASGFPSSQSGGTLPTPTWDCGGKEREEGGWARRLFSNSLLQTRVRETSVCTAAPRGCSALSPEPRVRSLPAAGPGPRQPKCPQTRRALRTWPAAARQASGAGHGLSALAVPEPRGRGSRPARWRGAGELEPALVTAAPPIPQSRPGVRLIGAEGPPGSAFYKHTFVSTHATGARAHSPAGGRRRL